MVSDASRMIVSGANVTPHKKSAVRDPDLLPRKDAINPSRYNKTATTTSGHTLSSGSDCPTANAVRVSPTAFGHATNERHGGTGGSVACRIAVGSHGANRITIAT